MVIEGFPVDVRPALCRDMLGQLSAMELVSNMELAEALFKAAYPNKDAWKAMKPVLEVIAADWQKRYGGSA